MNSTPTEGKGLNLGGSTTTSVDPRDARIAELESQLNATRVEQGRVRALSQDSSKKDEEIRQLKAQLDSQSRKFQDMVPEHLRQNVSEEVMQAAGMVSQGVVSEQMQALERRLAEAEERKKAQEAQIDAQNRRAFIERIEAKYPGFLGSVNPGGDKVAPWDKFLEVHKPSVLQAYGSMNLSAMSSLIDSFLSMIGVSQRGGDANPQHTPRSISGGQADGSSAPDGTHYTYAEFTRALDKAGADFHSGQLPKDKYDAVVNQLRQARKEGRVALPVPEAQ